MTMPNRVQRRGRRAQSGFTLIELLVVIAILGVLAGIVVFNVAGVTNRGSTAACNTDKSTVQAAEDAYRSDHSFANGSPGAPVSVTTLFNAGYLHSDPSVSGACASISVDGSGNVQATPK